MTIAFRSVLVCAISIALSIDGFAGEVKAFPTKGVDLNAFKTFKILPTRILTKRGVLENDPEVSPVINAAIRKQLAAKGLVEANEGADLHVSAGALVEVSAQVEAIVYNISMDASWSTSPLLTVGRYNKEGTLIVNMIDPRTNKSVWVGFAKRALGRPGTGEATINKAASDLFKKYPARR